jgi:hypothetical protein
VKLSTDGSPQSCCEIFSLELAASLPMILRHEAFFEGSIL